MKIKNLFYTGLVIFTFNCAANKISLDSYYSNSEICKSVYFALENKNYYIEANKGFTEKVAVHALCNKLKEDKCKQIKNLKDICGF